MFLVPFAALARWSRIALIRELSSAAAADGGATASKFGTKFARQARESAAERQKRYQQKCQIIFDRQVGLYSHSLLKRVFS